MPIWTHELPADANEQSLPIRRTPANGVLRAVVTSPDFIGTYTHFFHGRTTPCERPDCEACLNGMPYRYHSYVGAWHVGSSLHFIFELTAQATEALVKFRDAHETLRGCAIEAYRWGKRANGRVILKTAVSAYPITSLPIPPAIIKCLSVLWNLPLEKLDPTGRTNQGDQITILDDVTANMLNKPPS